MVVLLLSLVSACTTGTADPAASEAAAVDTVPVIPGVTEAAPVPSPSAVATVAPPVPRPRAGDHILVDLEGRVTNRDAADVVVRTERGVELDRYRLAGAIEVHAEPGGRWALVDGLEGKWAVLDGVSGTLTLLPFQGQAPQGAPGIQGPVAWWNDRERPWLSRLDGSDPIDLAERLGEAVQVQSVTADGSHALATGSRTYIIDTVSGDSRAIEQTSFVSLAPDGRVLAVTPGAGSALLTVEDVDGGGRRELALLARPGHPIPLADGRVLVAGQSSAIVGDDGTQTAVPPILGVESAPIVSSGGRVVVVPTAEGLTLVDLAEGTVSVIADTVGHTPPMGGGRWLWSVSADPSAPGALVIDTETATVVPLLPDTPTSEIGSVTLDGSLAAVLTGPGGSDAVILGVDGGTQPVVGDARVVDVALHPLGTFSAAALVVDTTRLLLVREGPDQEAQIDTGRSPVWLRTTE